MSLTSSFLPPPSSCDVFGLHQPQEEEGNRVLPFIKYLQDSSYVRGPLTDVAWASFLRQLQVDEKRRILNDRSHKGIQITPIALLYPPFGEFLDHIHDPPVDSDDNDLAKLEAAVNEFSYQMCQYYGKEFERRKGLLSALNAKCYLPSHLRNPAHGVLHTSE